MQRSLGLSIQLPNDESSLLPLHSDAWSEDSPYEVVLWIPFVDYRRTKSMFLLPPAADRRWRERMAEFANAGVEALYRAVEPVALDRSRLPEVGAAHQLLQRFQRRIGAFAPPLEPIRRHGLGRLEQISLPPQPNFQWPRHHLGH